MVNHVSVIHHRKYLIKKMYHVKVDVLLINNGLIKNVHVFLDIVGGINNVENAQIMLIQALINLLVFLKILMLTTILKIIQSMNVEKIKL